MLEHYHAHIAERREMGIPPKPLNTQQATALVAQLSAAENQSSTDIPAWLDLLTYHISPGVDDAAQVKAAFLGKIVRGEITVAALSPIAAVRLLATMQGGYNIQPLIDALDNDVLADEAVKALSHTLLIFDYFNEIEKKARQGNVYALRVLQSWADAAWFTVRPALAEKITLTVFKVSGETNTDDLSPAPEAWSRPDIPLHALCMLSVPRDGVTPDKPGSIGPVAQMLALKAQGYPLVYVGDVVGTGSSRKSATNSILWHIGQDIPFVPNKRAGGVVLAGKIAPIFFNTLEDSGALPIEMDVAALATGDVIDIYPYQGEVRRHDDQTVLTRFTLKTDVLLDEVRAGGRIALIIGRSLTARARQTLGLAQSTVFRLPKAPTASSRGYTLAQKIVGKACGVAGVRPGQYCEPCMTTVGSQDTTGGMTRDELKDLACLQFSADLVMQSFCHTSAYPKPVDVNLHKTLPDFITRRNGVSLRPGDGIIHSWLNRMLMPDTVGTGADSHTRFPVGLSFPGGSGLVAFAAATGIMPLDMPESVLVRFKGQMQPGITLRDLVHAIPYFAIQQGLLTVVKQGKKNIFSGRILEIEGLSGLSVEQAFELADASAERSAAACTIKLEQADVETYLRSNVALLRTMIAEGYQDAPTLARRIERMEQWLDDPQLLTADADAEYAAVIEIDLATIREPILCVPNDPDDVKTLSEVAGNRIDEVFIGSCMTNIGHFRAAGKLMSQHQGDIAARLWLAPPTRMDAHQLSDEGYFSQFIKSGVRIEPAGCSLCMGNQARVNAGSHVVSTSTRNFPHRLGTDASVYLASAELSTVAAILGRLPTTAEYLQQVAILSQSAPEIYRYLNFASPADPVAEKRIPIQAV
ncbi:bifunctional aconitate hydratase 2/2-methylisocitrate dehydratase [Dickeya dadantii]|uniref:bifunctional aconitate hydratase 2/2-methylisocitrate dehydratase n=1 Tax=Dickeya dadantii TaxID=204038 RepID=UPI001495667B|nr:bifunctional aconitate hydratase 2/2-methylisocitrate dehydratase [Dickeya dadantii]NPE55764.1 bifunctional aconitate hydratase 2/2-methylisocitrate dehydratase [Dickeya dadantii]NPE68595.1 bifunctional aconitate hydratase 2/2-methylisocitrate dehydratase [Dickeya dadantii]